MPNELVYSGKYILTDAVEDSPLNAGELVLSPTRTYAPVIKQILDEYRSKIHGWYIAQVEHKQKFYTL